MGIFDDIMTNAKQAADTISRKATDTYDIVKLKTNKSRIESDIKKNLAVLGGQFYLANKSETVDTFDFSAVIGELDELYLQLENITSQIEKAKNFKRCDVCGEYCELSKSFCPECGNPLK